MDPALPSAASLVPPYPAHQCSPPQLSALNRGKCITTGPAAPLRMWQLLGALDHSWSAASSTGGKGMPWCWQYLAVALMV